MHWWVGWRENWRVSTHTSWPPKASRRCFTKNREVFHLRVEGLDALEVTERVREAIERAGIGYGG
jgi:hypothetical protein